MIEVSKKMCNFCSTSARITKKHLRWLNESLKAAMEAIYNRCSMKRATLKYNIPRTMLQDQITGNVEHGSRPGTKPCLNKGEETELANFLKVFAQTGYGKTREQIMGIVESTSCL